MKQTRRLPGSGNIIASLLVCLATGCSSMSNTDKGAIGGGLIGAGTGAAIGHALGNTGAGAVIGTGVGMIGGALTGNAIDKAEHKAEVAQAQADAAVAARQVGMTDVVSMAQQHISDPVIIQQIRSSGSVFHLSANDIGYLKANGVSDRVVMEMQATATRPVVRPVYGRPVYVYEPPPPPPPVRVGFGVGYCHH